MTRVVCPGNPGGSERLGWCRHIGTGTECPRSKSWLPLCLLPAPPVPASCCLAPMWKHLGNCGVHGFGLQMAVVAGVGTWHEYVNHRLPVLSARGLEQLERPRFSAGTRRGAGARERNQGILYVGGRTGTCDNIVIIIIVIIIAMQLAPPECLPQSGTVVNALHGASRLTWGGEGPLAL